MPNDEEFEFDDQRKDEEIILVKHQHPWVLAKLGLVIVILAALVFLAFLIWGASLNSTIVLIAAVLILAIYISIRVFLYRNSLFILTNQRVIYILQSSLFIRRVQETELENLYNLQYRMEGAMKSLLNYGDLDLTTEGESEDAFHVKSVENPHAVFEQISNARVKAIAKKESTKK